MAAAAATRSFAVTFDGTGAGDVRASRKPSISPAGPAAPTTRTSPA